MIGLLLHLLDNNQVLDTEWRYMRLRQLQRAAQVDLELARRNPDLSDTQLMGLIRDVRQLDAEVKRMEPLRTLDRGDPRNAAKHAPSRLSVHLQSVTFALSFGTNGVAQMLDLKGDAMHCE